MGTNDRNPAESSAGVDIAVGGRRAASIMMDDRAEPNAEKPAFRDHDGSGVVADIQHDKLEVRTRGGPAGSEEDLTDDQDDELEGDGSEGSETSEEGSGTKDPDDKGEPAGDLGEFDPTDGESVAKFEAAYLTDAGGPNLQALMQEFDKNEAGSEDKEGSLNEGTYKFLEDRFGLSRDEIKDIEAGQKAKRDAANTTFNKAVDDAGGGRERVLKMVEWGKKGGYTKAQRDKFSADVNSGDPERAAAAVALLATRYSSATGDHAPTNRRGVAPKRDVARGGSGKGSGAVTPYESPADYRKDNKAARDSGDPQKLSEVRRRLKASKWYSGNKG